MIRLINTLQSGRRFGSAQRVSQMRTRGTNSIRQRACRLSFAFAGLLAAMSWSTFAAADDLFVDPNGTDGSQCLNLFNPCLTIEYALGQSAPGDNVFVSPGTYNEHSLTISHDLTITGASPGQGVTIIDAQTLGWHFWVRDQANLVLFRDLTFRNGDNANGGALLVTAGAIEVVRGELIDNSGFDGGAIQCGAGCQGVTIRDSKLKNNVATNDGGAIYVTLTGAPYVNVQSSKLHANTANEGGAIYKLSGDLIVSDSELANNVADDGDGGAIWSLDGNVTIRRSLLAANDATYYGIGEGGGIFMQGGTGQLLVTNSTFSGNTAWAGGALLVIAPASAAVANATFMDNTATAGFAGVGQVIVTDGAFQLDNSIITHSVANAGDDCLTFGIAMTGEGNLIDDNAPCPGVVANFRLGAITPATISPALVNHNGPLGTTKTHDLLPGSNAVDAGLNSCPSPGSGASLDYDQRYVYRPQRGVVYGVAVCDIGAFEQLALPRPSTVPAE